MRRTTSLALLATTAISGRAYIRGRTRRRRRHRRLAAKIAMINWSVGAGEPHDETALFARMNGDLGGRILLLHGIGGSNAIWSGGYDVLAQTNRVIAVDLLGHGRSPHPESGYSIEHHVALIGETLTQLGVADAPLLVIGHSFGAALALALAHHRPQLVRGIVAIAPVVYASSKDARRFAWGAFTPLERVLFMPSPVSRAICRGVCSARPNLAFRVARKMRPEMPHLCLTDMGMHTWESYSGCMGELLGARARPDWAVDAHMPVHFMFGARDRQPDRDLFEAMATRSALVTTEVIDDADHLLPLTHASRCVAAIREIDRLASGAGSPGVISPR